MAASIAGKIQRYQDRKRIFPAEQAATGSSKHIVGPPDEERPSLLIRTPSLQVRQRGRSDTTPIRRTPQSNGQIRINVPQPRHTFFPKRGDDDLLTPATKVSEFNTPSTSDGKDPNTRLHGRSNRTVRPSDRDRPGGLVRTPSLPVRQTERSGTTPTRGTPQAAGVIRINVPQPRHTHLPKWRDDDLLTPATKVSEFNTPSTSDGKNTNTRLHDRSNRTVRPSDRDRPGGLVRTPSLPVRQTERSGTTPTRSTSQTSGETRGNVPQRRHTFLPKRRDDDLLTPAVKVSESNSRSISTRPVTTGMHFDDDDSDCEGIQVIEVDYNLYNGTYGETINSQTLKQKRSAAQKPAWDIPELADDETDEDEDESDEEQEGEDVTKRLGRGWDPTLKPGISVLRQISKYACATQSDRSKKDNKYDTGKTGDNDDDDEEDGSHMSDQEDNDAELVELDSRRTCKNKTNHVSSEEGAWYATAESSSRDSAERGGSEPPAGWGHHVHWARYDYVHVCDKDAIILDMHISTVKRDFGQPETTVPPRERRVRRNIFTSVVDRLRFLRRRENAAAQQNAAEEPPQPPEPPAPEEPEETPKKKPPVKKRRRKRRKSSTEYDTFVYQDIAGYEKKEIF